MKRKNYWLTIMTILLATVLCACSDNTAPNDTPNSGLTDTTAVQEETPVETQITLYADFTAGYAGEDASDMIMTTVETTTETVDGQYLADRLSEWTGLDFTLNEVTVADDSAKIDWAANSTLVAGLDDREQKDEFHFFDVESLNWFMMDSLARTVNENEKHIAVDCIDALP